MSRATCIRICFCQLGRPSDVLRELEEPWGHGYLQEVF